MKAVDFLSFFILLFFIACSASTEEKVPGIKEIVDLKTKQYAIQGQQLYLNYCSNCHQEDGSGLKRLIPPLRESDYLLADVARTIRIIHQGIQGEMMVNGVMYNQPMPGNPQLTPLEIAQISTYIYNIWGHQKGIISSEKVNEALKPESNSDVQ
ncbi:c-type cytochrome [Cyclobacterium jeungdonense]|uniref:Cytochrome c n=1 Tax=Cyclobacterium jeungdonense TaxID=708087 RepID=A0ABT8C9E3_9BACT|nr:cytochrome c [Cyclobacterium jeungdonense]MDN3689425.1 cytochrome c [Cyclobacterium jeungdonense]